MAKRKVKQDKLALGVRGVIDENLSDLKSALMVFVENVSSVLKEPGPPRNCDLTNAIAEHRRAASEMVLFVKDLASQIETK